jgi:hypothetical protein
MKHVNTDRRLELVKTIRMQNQYNRQKCRERELFLEENPFPEEKSKGMSGFRLRFILAALLFGAFVCMDKKDLTVFGNSTAILFDSLTESLSFPVDIPLLNSFDL